MSIEILQPASREEWLNLRRVTVGASEVASLLSAHPYLTSYALWSEKTGRFPEIEASPAMRRGQMLEPIAVAMVAEERPDWKLTPNVIPGGNFYRDREAGISCTPDCFASDPARPGFGNVQLKSAAPGIFKGQWRDDNGEIAPPMHVVIQAIVEATLTGASWCAVGVLVVDYGIDLYMIDVPLHEGLMTRVHTEVRDFWRLLDSGQRPPIDWKRDADLVARLYEPEGKEIVDMTSDNELPQLADRREALRLQKKEVGSELDENRAKILDKLAGAGAVRLADGRLITANRVNRKAYTAPATSYLDLRIREVS